ncbi:TonB-dependent receptor [Terriglobus roseus]|uniref:TonB-dependent receptor n=1 Tax=Terriglobus roseus TaxID=392734 RepID=UPI0002DC9ECC|nr:TonB-dependent receptor [Terriglobus roseus]
MLALSCGLGQAQTTTGSVSGTVQDASGAVVPNAVVAAINADTGVRTEATTNGAGVYSIRFLPIGRYKVEVNASSFATFATPVFQLEINQSAKIDAKLSVNSITTVDVEASAAPILNTSDGAIGLSLSEKQISTIPLNGRNFSSLTLFQPGAVNTDPNGLTGGNALERNTFNNGIVALNGNRAQANNYTLDGIDINEGQNNLIGYNPAPDALAEIRVVTANAGANYGNVNGGDIVSVLKSGTNQFHGSAYAYLQNQKLNANSWANKNHPDPADFQPINPYTQTQFGGTLGGPILHDKLFFFVDYEGTRQHKGGTSSASVFTAAMRGGDFSAVPKQLYDTQNNLAPYANNRVRVVNPVAQYLFAHPELYPLPNATPVDGLIQNNYIGFTRSFIVNNQGDLKIEWDPRNNDKVTAFYAQSTGSDGSIALLPISFPAQNVFPTKLGGGTWVHTFSPSIVNEGRVGFTRVRWDQGVPTDPSGLFGLTGNKVVGIPFGTQRYVGFSNINISDNFSSFGTPGAPQILRDNTFFYEDNVTIQHGKHLFTIGAQAIRYQQNYALSGAQGSLGSFSYGGQFTGDGTNTGYSGADFVLDRANSESIAIPGGSGLVGNRQWRTAGFFQDDWKATDRLTLNIGLRYEYDQRWNEVHNRTANVLLDGPNKGTVEYAGSVPAGAPAGSIVCDNISCYQPARNQLQPRFGFAFQATPRFVLRGGYGTTSFFEGNANNQRLTYQNPFLAFAQPNAATPVAAANGVPYSPGAPLHAANGFTISDINNSNASFGAWPQNMRPAYIHQFNLTTEYELNNRLSLAVSYVGETGQHLADYRNGNQLTLAQARALNANGGVVTAATTAPFAALVGQTGALLITESAAMSNYNAGQVTLRERGEHGLTYTINYTYSKALTNSAGNYTAANIRGQNGAYEDGYNSAADYGLAGSDIAHNVSAVVVYAVPFGRGQSYGGSINRIADLALGGWSVSGSVVAYSGFPLTINGPGNTSDTNSFGGMRANRYRTLKVKNRTVDNWFGTDPSATPCAGTDNGICAYGPAAALSFGTASVGSERAPGYLGIDASVFKDFHITESQAFGFRADGFNVGNIASYGNPDSNVTDVNFGQITNTRSASRVIQLQLHYNF